MPKFKVLEAYGSNFGDTASVGDSYKNELGKSGERRNAVYSKLMEKDGLKDLMAAARNNQTANRTPQSTNVKGVKGLAAFHTGQQGQNKTAVQNKLNDDVIWMRKWLSRQGAWFSGLDEINWRATMRLKVVYDTELRQQNATEITIVAGKLFTANGQPLDTTKMVTHFSGPGFAIYVMSNTGRLYVSSHSVGHYHHSSLLAGVPVACAGEIKVSNGIITLLSNKSGHYKPVRVHLLQVLAMLQSKGSELTFPLVYTNEAVVTTRFINVEAYLAANQLDNASYVEVVAKVASLVGNYGSGYGSPGPQYGVSAGAHQYDYIAGGHQYDYIAENIVAAAVSQYGNYGS